MMYYRDKSGTSRYTLQDFEPTFGQKMSAATKQAWRESYGPTVSDYFKRQDDEGEKLSIDDGKAYAESLGGFYQPSEEMTRAQIDFLSNRQRELITIQDIQSRTPWDAGSPLRGVAMFGAQALDPLNLATAFVPWTRAIPALRALSATAATGTTAARIASRTALGAADAAISTAALEAPYAAIRRSLGDDYDAYDSMVNIAFGTAFGGGIHAIGGIGSALYRKYGPPSRRAIDAGPLPEVITPDIPVNRFADLPTESKTVIARLLAEQPEVRETFQAARGAEISEPDIIRSLEVDAIAEKVQINAEQIANIEQVRDIQSQPNEPIIVRQTEDGQFEVLAGDVSQIQAGQTVEAVDATQALAIEPERLTTEPEPRAAETVQQATPQQREAALRTAIDQAVTGQNVDVAPIFDEQPSQTKLQAAMQKAYQPENLRTADFDSARQVETEPAKEWRTLQDAQRELAEAETHLNEVIRAGNEAFKYSRSKITATSSKADIENAVKQSFGKASKALLERAQVEVVQSVKDIPNGPHPQDVKAATAPDGKVYIVAENVSPSQIRGLMLHEVGVHVGMRDMLGDELFESVLNQVDQAIIRGEAYTTKAREAVPLDTPSNLVREEQLAYLVENATELGIVKRIIAAVRAWVVRTFGDVLKLNEADLRALAAVSLRSVVKRQGFESFAFFRDTPKTIKVDGVDRPTANSDGRPIANSKEAIENFWRWFGNSKVVDAEGRPLVVYHGTNADFSEFSDVRKLGGIFFSPTPVYPGKKGRAIMPVYLSIQELSPSGMSIENAKEKGFSGSLFGSVTDHYSEFVVFDQKNIKSATGNIGTFDPTTADIRYSRGKTLDHSTVKDALKPFDDELDKARKTGQAIRAAADKLGNETQAIEAMRAQYPNIPTEEAQAILKELTRQTNRYKRTIGRMEAQAQAESQITEFQSESMKAADEMANNIEMAAIIEKRNAALNIAAEMKMKAFVAQFNKPGLDVEGFIGYLTGSERLRSQARASVDFEYKTTRAKWLGGMLADLEQANLTKAFSRGVFDRDIYDALYRMGDNLDMKGLPQEAVQIAQIINKYQQSARNTRNRFGAWIGDLKGYVTRQSHDMYKIRDAGENTWIDAIMPRLDIAKMRELGVIGDDVRGGLALIYRNLASGVAYKPPVGEVESTGFKGSRNVAKRESQSRVLHFKDGISAFEYNEQFGQGRLVDSVFFGLDSAARSTALLKKLGTNPESMLNKVMDEYGETLKDDPKRANDFQEKRQAILDRLAEIDGSTRIPGSVRWAKVGAFSRAWMNMAKLGGVLISSLTDLPNYGADLRYGQGKNLLEGSLDGVLALTSKVQGKRKDILNSLGVFHESTLGGVINRFDSPEIIGGKMSALMNTYFKVNGLSWWTESLRDGAALSYAQFIGNNATAKWADLPSELSRIFEQYGIDEGKWDILRRATRADDEGRVYVTPDSLAGLPDALLAGYLKARGDQVNESAVANLRDDLSDTLRGLYIDRAHHAVLEPNARVRAWMTKGTRPGTFGGELIRYIGQFKSFPVAMVQMVLGREVYGRGYDTIGDYLKNGKGDMIGLASYIALTTGMGYAVMAIKDMLKGREPRNPADPKTFLAAMIQGGGLGLYGDFLFGEYNRFGGTLSSSLAGPVIGFVDTLADLKTRIQNNDDSAAAIFKAMLDNTPFLNLFYLRIALDYSILYAIQESLNPGFLRRMERRLQRENNQDFLFPPTEYATQF